METRVVYLEPGKISIDSVQLPDIKPNQVLIKAHQASICGSERYFYRGITVRPEDEARGGPETRLGASRTDSKSRHEYPMGPLGHEGGGTIIEKDSSVDEYPGGGKVSVGDRVASLVYPTFTDYWVTDIAHVQPIPEDVSFEVGCLYEPLGCAVWAARHMGVKLGDTVAVNGVGFAGSIMLQGALKSGASKVIAVDVIEAKLQIAAELGAQHTIRADATDPVQAVLDITGGIGVDIAVEAVGGTGIGIQQALGMVKHNGVLALYGDNYQPVEGFCFNRFHEDGLKIRNLNAVHFTRLQSIENMREAYTSVQRGVFNLDVVFKNSVTHTLADIQQALAEETPALKTLIVP